MRNWISIRDRYLQDSYSIRLGEIATNLARIGTFTGHPANKEVVYGLLEETKFFIEWVAAEAEVEVGARLVEMQVQLAVWQLDWNEIWSENVERQAIGREASKWSDEVMEFSGLLEEGFDSLKKRIQVS